MMYIYNACRNMFCEVIFKHIMALKTRILSEYYFLLQSWMENLPILNKIRRKWS